VEEWAAILPGIVGALVLRLIWFAVGALVLYLIVKAAVRRGTAQALEDSGLAAVLRAQQEQQVP